MNYIRDKGGGLQCEIIQMSEIKQTHAKGGCILIEILRHIGTVEKQCLAAVLSTDKVDR